MKLKFTFLLIVCFCCREISAQSFINGDLDGTIFGLTSLPDDWNAVPFTDPVCQASNVNCATPDLTDTAGPVVFLGIMGNPYSGLTFVSGEHALSNTGDLFHEGISQLVGNLIPGTEYTIRFFQSVVKSNVALDTTGSWIVYYDTSLIAVTAPTYSAAPFNSINFGWELREMNFVAQQTIHNIKFLPLDDDTDHQVGSSLSGALRMGIDSISIFPAFTGLNNPDKSVAYIMYPNPATEAVNILFKEPNEDHLVTITDMQGKELQKLNTGHAGHVRIDLPRTQGCYMVKVSSGGRQYVSKLLITHQP